MGFPTPSQTGATQVGRANLGDGQARLFVLVERLQPALEVSRSVDLLLETNEILEGCGIAGWIATTRGRVVTANEAFRRLVPQGVVAAGLPLKDALAFESPADLATSLAGIGGRRSPLVLHGKAHSPLGVVPVRVWGTALRATVHVGGVVGVVGVVEVLDEGPARLLTLAKKYRKLRSDERRVIGLLIAGYGNAEIALRLGISSRTVETRRKAIRDGLGLESMFTIVHALARLEAAGVIDLEIPWSESPATGTGSS